VKKKSSKSSNASTKSGKKEVKNPSGTIEYKQVEKKPGISDQTYRSIINSIDEAIYIQDKDGTFLDVNDGAVKMYGYTREELIGKNPLLVSAEGKNDLPKVVEQVKVAFGGIPQELEFWGKRKNGEIFPKNVRLYKGEYFGKDVVIAVAQDITERKKAEAALKESEGEYRQLVENSPIGIYRTTPDGRILEANQALSNMLGYKTFEEYSSRNLEIEPDATYNRQGFKEKLERENKIIGLEAEWLKKDGTPLFVRENAQAVRDANGAIIYYEGTVEDITERKHAADKLKESENRYRLLVNNSPDAIGVHSEGKIVFVNNAAVKLFGGNKKEDLIGIPILNVVHPDSRAVVLQRLQQMQNGNVVPLNEEKFLRLDGTPVDVEVTAMPLTLGNKQAFQVVIRDITERKLAGQKLKASEEQHKSLSSMFRLVSDNSEDLLWAKDLDNKYIFTNKAMCDKLLLANDTDEPIGKDDLFFARREREAHPENPEWHTFGEICANTDEVIHKEKTAKQFDEYGNVKGKFLFLDVRKAPIWDNNGKMIGVVGTARDVTNEKALENETAIASEKLKASEELFRNLIENITDVFYISDGQGRMKYCSPNFFKFTGFSPQEILEHIYIRVVAPADRKEVVEHYTEATKSGVLDTNFELRVQRKDGSIFWAEQNTRIIRDEKGNVVEYRNIACDVTKRKQAEEALKKSEEWFRNLFEKASDGIFHLSLSGKIVSVNKSFALMHGYTVEELQKMNLNDLDTPETSQQFPERMRRLLEGESLTFEVEHYHKDGHTFPLEVTASLITVGDEKFIMAFHRDITERKKSADALRVSEERFRLISSLSSDYLFSTKITEDGNAELDWVLGAFEKITGYTLEEYKAIGGWRAVLHPDDRGKDSLDFQKLLNNEKVISEVRTIQKNGNIVWTRSYARPIWDEKANKLIGIYGAVQDITEQKSAEEELRKSELHFRSVWESSASGMRVTNEEGIIISVNNAFCRMVGKTKEELEGFPVSSIYFEQEGQNIQQKHKERFKTRTVRNLVEQEFMMWDGKKVWLRVINSFIESENAEPLLLGVFTEITEQKLAEEKVQKQCENISHLFNLSKAVSRAESLEKVYSKALNSILLSLTADRASLLLFDEQGVMKFIEWRELSEEYRRATEGHSPWKRDAKNPEPILVENVENEPYLKSLLPAILKEGIRSLAFVPLVNQGILLGKFMIYYNSVHLFSEAEMNLLKTFSSTIAFAIYQKKAEVELHKLGSAVEQSAGSIVITDLEGNIEYVNKKFGEVTGYSFEEVKGQNPRILKSGETPANIYKDMWETVLAGSDWRGTFHNKRKDGSLYWETTTISPIKNSEGKITNLLAIKDDITEDKLKEERLQKSELHFRSVWESSIDGMRLTDENGIIVSVNGAFAKLFEKDKNEIIGQSFAVVYGKDSRLNNVTSFIRHFRERTFTPFLERDITLWNGKPMSVELTDSFVEIEGQPPLLLTIFRNVTEKKQSEREIILAKESAEEANKVKTNFLENMSHELRTPMIPILGFTETLAEMDDLPEDVKEMAVMMNQGARRLLDTLNIILDLSQIEKERVVIKPAEFNLLRILDEIGGLFQSVASKKSLYLKKEFGVESLNIYTDERMLRQIINNLVNNGLKFTQTGGVTIKAQVEKSGNDTLAVIQVCDTGIGISKEKQKIIWTEFRQASEGVGRSFEGNGLGLTITKNFIEKLGGTISVESQPGIGSTFTIKIPTGKTMDVQEIEINEKVEVKKSLVQEVPSVAKSLSKILYVEDEEISFSVVKHFLKNIATLDWARNGQDGVVMARGTKYEAILMDINLAKGIDGMQTTKLIRELPQYQNTPIVAITAFAMRGDKEEFLGAGCSHYISKPFTKAALQELMEEVLLGKENEGSGQ